VRDAEKSTKPHRARINVGEESLSFDLSARGKSRRKKKNCRFPPLRISFPTPPGRESIFHGQRRIKLVTHCNRGKKAEQVLLREYATYRLFDLVTPKSLKVRLARINYLDGETLVASKYGFLIEDADDAARRLGMKEIDIGDISVNALDPHDATRLAIFQYLIGNTDWAMVVGPNPNDCCHNAKLLGPDSNSTRSLTPVPYDFDNAGIVDAPYAYPNATLGTNSVKVRVYRGFCLFNDLVSQEVGNHRMLKAELEEEIANIPGLETETQDKMRRYLSSGYEAISDPKLISRRLLKKCR